ncbi:hypothetical protein ACVWYH_008611 [Bradyrhizobium sp. GM24.11]
MVQAIVFLPLLGAILAGLIALFGAHVRNPSGDKVEHHGDHGHGAHTHASDTINEDASVVHESHHEPGDGHDGHGPVEPAAAGSRGAELITTAFLFVAAALSWMTLVDVGFNGHDARIQLLPWIFSGELEVWWTLRVDTLTAVMLVVVTTVSSLVHLYSIGYMDEDPYRPRFFGYLSLFTFRHADAGDRRQPRADVLRLGRRGSGELSADRILVPEAVGERGGHQGLRGQSRR